MPFPFFKIKKIGKCIFALQIPEEETGSFPYYFIWKKYNMKPLLLKYLSVCACMLSHFSCVWLSAVLWTVACQAPLSMGFSKARTLEWVAMPSSRGSSGPRDWTHGVSCIFCITDRFFTTAPLVKPILKYTICYCRLIGTMFYNRSLELVHLAWLNFKHLG